MKHLKAFINQTSRLWSVLVLVLFFLPHVVSAEYIESFTSLITPHSDGSFTVTETILYNFEGAEKHGIYRFIPTKHAQEPSKWYLTRYNIVDIETVTLNGEVVPYTEENEEGLIRVEIGDANKTITGTHEYEIVYTVDGGLSYYDYGTTDLYWNATGHEWQVPIRNVYATVVDTEGLLKGTSMCYLGAYGNSASCGVPLKEGNSVTYSARELAPYVGVTISHELNSSMVARIVFETFPMLWLMAGIVAAWFMGLGFFVYQHITHFKIGRTIIVEYEPYESIEPMYTGLLIDGRLDSKDITAGLVYLAEQGFLKIKKIEKKVLFLIEVDDYEITLLKRVAEAPTKFHQDLVSLLFERATAVGSTVTLGDLKHNLSVQKRNRLILRRLTEDARRDLVVKGFYENNLMAFFNVVWFPILVGVLMLHLGVFKELTFLWVTMFMSGFILLLAHRRRTRKGFEAQDHLKGFKEFLSVTDKERFDFHNAPEKNPEQFMKFLPYAIAFGVETKWAEAFKDMTIPDPSWYDGGSVGHFSSSSLTSSLGAFSTAFASSSGASSPSGTSSSSGGGFSGGGGGGGGGGSW